jgi:uncharacterized glyoxalase superfamily protein PhnB
VFDAPIDFEDADSVVLRFGDTLVNLLAVSAADDLIGPARVAGAPGGSRIQLTVGVDDVDETCSTLASRGVSLLNGPMNRSWGPRTASFQDPGGHIWEIATIHAAQ